LTPLVPLRLALAWFHLLALGVGLGGVWARARALHDSLRDPVDERAIKRALAADAWWGIAAVVWLVTGLWRLIAGTEKSTAYYLSNYAFNAKMGMFVAILALEAWPMMTLIRWRMGKREPNTRDAGRIEVISYVECALVVAMVFAAVSMARGFGVPRATAAATLSDSLTALGDSGDAPPTVPSTTPATLAAPLPTPTSSDLQLLIGELAMPLAGIDPAKLQSNFSALRGGNRRHEALDIMAPRRTPVMSAAAGHVLKLFTSRAGGLMVYAADSAERFILMYAHLDEYAAGLHDGQPLSRGQLIGYVGFTGNASPKAPHLHFAIARSDDVRRWSKGTPVDPLPLLQAAHR
jgi:peptidoglycan LD-endopeptidase LytH